MRLFIYKSFVIFIGIYLLYNFTIGKKIDDYEKKLVNFATDEGREKLRNLIRKEIKNTIDISVLNNNSSVSFNMTLIASPILVM